MLSNVDPALRRAWHPVARAEEVGPGPLAVRLLGEDWVVVRLSTGLAAFPDRCPHRFAPLSAGRVEGQVLRCGYHGWCFDRSGACVEVPSLPSGPRPARAVLAAAHGVVEHQGVVFLAPEAPVAPLLEVPEVDDDRFDGAWLELRVARAGAGLLADNFLDMSHFAFVHAATIGADDNVTVADMAIVRDEMTMTVTSRHPFPHREDPGYLAGERPLIQHRRVTYRYSAPFSLALRLDYEEAGGANVIRFLVQPVDAQSCRIFCSIHRDDLAGDARLLAAAVAYETTVVEEDLALQERYGDLRLPLDPTAEVHVKADRATIELRRILATLVRGSG